jgi:hypothetical protein
LSSRFSVADCSAAEETRLSGERVITRADSFQSTSPSSPLGRTPPNPRDLPLLFSRMDAFRFTRNGDCRTIDLLARRIGLRRDATRAPMQVRNGWRPSGRRSDQPAAPSKNGRNFVQPMGSTSVNDNSGPDRTELSFISPGDSLFTRPGICSNCFPQEVCSF